MKYETDEAEKDIDCKKNIDCDGECCYKCDYLNSCPNACTMLMKECIYIRRIKDAK